MRLRTQTQRGCPPLALVGIVAIGGGESYIRLCCAVLRRFSAGVDVALARVNV